MSIPGAASPLFIGAAAGAAAAYQIDRSLRFNQPDSPRLSRTPSSNGNRRTFTISAWVKKSRLATSQFQNIVSAGNASPNNQCNFHFDNQGRLSFYNYPTGGVVTSAAKFRDFSAWMHCVASIDTTQSSSSNRVKIYVNNTQITDFSSNSRPSQNQELRFNRTTDQINVGANGAFNSHFFSGYIAEVHFIDGQALAPTDFAELDSDNNWNPKAYSGSYGTNGFYLKFADNSSNAALGTDSSGQNNTFTVHNLIATSTDYLAQGSFTASEWDTTNKIQHIFDGNDSTLAYRPNGAGTGTSTFTFGTTVTVTSSLQIRGWKGDSNERIFANGVDISSHFNTQSGGGLSTQNVTSTVGSTPFTLTSVGSENANNRAGALAKIIVDGTTLINEGGEIIDSLLDTPTNYDDGTNVGGNYCTWNFLNKSSVITLSNGNLDTSQTSTKGKVLGTIGVTSGKWYWEITATRPGYGGSLVGIAKANSTLTNGVGEDANSWSYANNGNKYTNGSAGSYGHSYGSGVTIGVAFDADAGTLTFYKDGISQGQAYSGLTSGPYFPAVGNDGYNYIANFGQRGSFTYAPPTGFKSICTTNLPDPTIADGSTAFNTSIWNGNSTQDRKISTTFSPDFVWVKRTNGSKGHVLIDKIRGDDNYIFSNLSDANQVMANLLGLVSDGYELGVVESVNATNNSYVGFAWDAGTSTVSNTDGSITSQVRANPTAGFSIVKYTGNGTQGASVGHGLNVAPEFVIGKRLSSNKYWAIYHKDVHPKVLYFDTSAAAQSQEQYNETRPTSSVVELGSSGGTTNTSGDDSILYCFAPVEGFSAMGSYVGNGSADGPFVFTGMRPRWIMIKASSSVSYGNWVIHDTARSTSNVSNKNLYANLPNAEDTTYSIDILSNGFKIRSSAYDAHNGNNKTYTYLAFAEHPFKTARAR